MKDLGGRPSDLWSDEVLDRLAKLWADETQTAKGIAIILSTEFSRHEYTKGAVIGKIHRTPSIFRLRTIHRKNQFSPGAKKPEKMPPRPRERRASSVSACRRAIQALPANGEWMDNSKHLAMALKSLVDNHPLFVESETSTVLRSRTLRFRWRFRLTSLGIIERAKLVAPPSIPRHSPPEPIAPVVEAISAPEPIVLPPPEIATTRLPEPSPEPTVAHSLPKPIRPEDFIATAPPTVRDYLGPREDGLISIVQLTETTCRWPIGEVHSPEFGYCGKPKSFGPKHPYCAACQLKSETPKATFLRRKAA